MVSPCVSSSASAIPARATPVTATMSASWRSTRSPARHGAPAWRRRFSGEGTEAVLGGQRVLILKPTTFMNDSGRAVAEAQRFFKIALSDVVVFHDELDLAPGKVQGEARRRQRRP